MSTEQTVLLAVSFPMENASGNDVAGARSLRPGRRCARQPRAER